MIYIVYVLHKIVLTQTIVLYGEVYVVFLFACNLLLLQVTNYFSKTKHFLRFNGLN